MKLYGYLYPSLMVWTKIKISMYLRMLQISPTLVSSAWFSFRSFIRDNWTIISRTSHLSSILHKWCPSLLWVTWTLLLITPGTPWMKHLKVIIFSNITTSLLTDATCWLNYGGFKYLREVCIYSLHLYGLPMFSAFGVLVRREYRGGWQLY